MINTTINVMVTGIVSVFGVLGLLAGVGVADLFVGKERSLALITLSYEDGLFTQQHKVEGGPIKGYWTAEIMRGNRQLCAGGGEAPYEGGVKKFNPNDWTGDDCPELQPGDIARAVWEYRLESGAIASINGQFVIE